LIPEMMKPTSPAESSGRVSALGVKTPTCSQRCVPSVDISRMRSFGRSVPSTIRTSITTPT
jgi:hypothetical protein